VQQSAKNWGPNQRATIHEKTTTKPNTSQVLASVRYFDTVAKEEQLPKKVPQRP